MTLKKLEISLIETAKMIESVLAELENQQKSETKYEKNL